MGKKLSDDAICNIVNYMIDDYIESLDERLKNICDEDVLSIIFTFNVKISIIIVKVISSSNGESIDKNVKHFLKMLNESIKVSNKNIYSKFN